MKHHPDEPEPREYNNGGEPDDNSRYLADDGELTAPPLAGPPDESGTTSANDGQPGRRQPS